MLSFHHLIKTFAANHKDNRIEESGIESRFNDGFICTAILCFFIIHEAIYHILKIYFLSNLEFLFIRAHRAIVKRKRASIEDERVKV